MAKIEELGVKTLVRDMVDLERPTWHDPKELARAFKEVMDECHIQER